MWTYYNPNPIAVRVGDCAVRAVAKAIGRKWEDSYLQLALMGLQMGGMPAYAHLRDSMGRYARNGYSYHGWELERAIENSDLREDTKRELKRILEKIGG